MEWPERAEGEPVDLGFSFGADHTISPDFASLAVGAMTGAVEQRTRPLPSASLLCPVHRSCNGWWELCSSDTSPPSDETVAPSWERHGVDGG